MFRSLSTRLSAFGRDARGNVAVTFALSATVLATAVGGGLDYSRSASIGTELQSALDSGALAAASLTQDRDPEAVVRAYVEAALADHPGLLESLALEVSSDISFNAREVDATASLAVPTTLLGVAGIDTLTLRREASAIEQVRDIEISLVLDISGSMGGSKIAALRDAAEEFIEVVVADNPERTSVSVIPYNGGVRLGEAVNSRLITGGRNNRERSGCAEYGDGDYVTDIELPERRLSWLEWRGQEQRDGRSSAFCPERDEAAVFLRRNPGALVDLIQDLDAGGNTGLDIATVWGARALDPAWRGALGGDFSGRPAAYDDEDTIKVLVVMTDGAATAQIRTYRRWGWWYNDELYSAREARENMAEACDEAQGKGVQVYTIAFQLRGSRNRDLMQGCASRPQNYHQVETMDIAAAFSAIAADISRLRLSR